MKLLKSSLVAIALGSVLALNAALRKPTSKRRMRMAMELSIAASSKPSSMQMLKKISGELSKFVGLRPMAAHSRDWMKTGTIL